MHNTRQLVSTKLPIQRKGTKYVARPLTHVGNSVPLVIAVRDMLKITRTLAEVKKLIKSSSLKINGRPVKDYRESICLFNILEAGKKYKLTILPTHRYSLVESDDSVRLCKVIGKRLVSGGAIQISLHDGTSLISDKKISVGDSVYLDFSGKMKSLVPLKAGSEIFVSSGKYSGFFGSVESMDGKSVVLNLKGKEAPVTLKMMQVVAI